MIAARRGSARATGRPQLVKANGLGTASPCRRLIAKPLIGSALIAINGNPQQKAVCWTGDTTTGLVTFQPGHIPPAGAAVTASFEFDRTVRFDGDDLEVDPGYFEAGQISHVPIIEIKV
jgi:uncharacterized protein (TIGR02217 family)